MLNVPLPVSVSSQLKDLQAALVGRYQILRELGAGGMATVYLAEDLKHDRKVAVKVLRPELAAVLGAERFVQEIKTTANLQHPHILPLFDSGEADSFLYYVMPFIDGETLRDKLDRETQLGIDEAVRITSEVADALDYAHRNNVIHRDIKPENILLHDGRPMVADFGIALAVSAAAGGRMTETGLSLGTPHYMSPEQATADKDLTNRSDIYSLGSVLYEMLTGEPPHLGGSAQAIIMKIVTEAAQPVTAIRKSVPPNVAAAVDKSLEKLPADRFESASKFAEALTNPAFTLPTAQVAATSASSTRRSTVGLRVFAAFAVVMALWGWLRPRPEAQNLVSRYSIALPDNEALGDRNFRGSHIAISPDGSRLVYYATSTGRAFDDENPDARLVVRNLDQLNATPIPGTEGGVHPFFSPDGSSVGFLQQDGWRTVSLDGGSAITIGQSGLAQLGGSWGHDGYLYFSGRLPGSGVVRVAEEGGPPEIVTSADTARAEAEHIWPVALPGGRGVVFTVTRGGTMDFDEWEIAVVDLTTGRHNVLGPGTRASFAAGHLFYVTAAGVLMAAPFDETTLAVTGGAVAIGDGLQIGFMGSADLAVSQTGTVLYTTGDLYRRTNAELVWVERDGSAEAIDPGWTEDFRQPALSPDGTRLAVSVREGEEQEIWIKELDRGPETKLTFSGTNFYPEWTPDGERLVYTHCCGQGLDLHTRRADGSGQEELLFYDERALWEVSYSPDGRWLVYGVNNPIRDLYALRIGADSTHVPLVVTEFDEVAHAVSADGRWLAYISDESGQDEVYVRPFPNTDAGQWLVSSNGGQEPVWARNGRELFYRSGGNMMAADVLPGATFAIGDRRVLFSTRGYRAGPKHPEYQVTPDGQRFLMIRDRIDSSGETELIVVENVFEELKAKAGR